jgi:hypothetical protein
VTLLAAAHRDPELKFSLPATVPGGIPSRTATAPSATENDQSDSSDIMRIRSLAHSLCVMNSIRQALAADTETLRLWTAPSPDCRPTNFVFHAIAAVRENCDAFDLVLMPQPPSRPRPTCGFQLRFPIVHQISGSDRQTLQFLAHSAYAMQCVHRTVHCCRGSSAHACGSITTATQKTHGCSL